MSVAKLTIWLSCVAAIGALATAAEATAVPPSLATTHQLEFTCSSTLPPTVIKLRRDGTIDGAAPNAAPQDYFTVVSINRGGKEYPRAELAKVDEALKLLGGLGPMSYSCGTEPDFLRIEGVAGRQNGRIRRVVAQVSLWRDRIAVSPIEELR